MIDFSKLKEAADDNYFLWGGDSLMKMAKISPKEKKTLGKGEIAHYKQFLLFPLFSKDLHRIHVKTRACMGKA